MILDKGTICYPALPIESSINDKSTISNIFYCTYLKCTKGLSILQHKSIYFTRCFPLIVVFLKTKSILISNTKESFENSFTCQNLDFIYYYAHHISCRYGDKGWVEAIKMSNESITEASF